jgi:hypothetical protein
MARVGRLTARLGRRFSTFFRRRLQGRKGARAQGRKGARAQGRKGLRAAKVTRVKLIRPQRRSRTFADIQRHPDTSVIRALRHPLPFH